MATAPALWRRAAIPALAVGLPLAALSLGIGLSPPPPASASPSPRLPPPPPAGQVARGLQTAILAGGCFWGTEAVFEHVKGVKSVTTGYAGGTRQTANYRSVAAEKTGHAEAIRIVYDPKVIRFGHLLQIFFAVAHDPTQVNRQTPDIGPSYRSAIFPQTGEQSRIARAYIRSLDASGVFARPLATKLETGTFYKAEAVHQDFARKFPQNRYIVRWDKPKIDALKKAFPKDYRPWR